jgi:hypothetical protein
MSGWRGATVARAFRRVALPLASYYAVTLAVPLANGAAPSGAFMEHALMVLVVPPVAIVLGCAVHTIAHTLARLTKPRPQSETSSPSRAMSWNASAQPDPQCSRGPGKFRRRNTCLSLVLDAERVDP